MVGMEGEGEGVGLAVWERRVEARGRLLWKREERRGRVG